VAEKDLKKSSISLALKEMQIKTVLRFHLNPVRMTTIMKTNKCWRGSQYGNKYGGSSKS
jgi:hypothetical protein